MNNPVYNYAIDDIGIAEVIFCDKNNYYSSVLIVHYDSQVIDL